MSGEAPEGAEVLSATVDASVAVPVLPAKNVERALNEYRDIGFIARLHRDGWYGYLRLGRARIDLIDFSAMEGLPIATHCFIYTDTPDELGSRMAEAGHGRVELPTDRAWGLREGHYVDTDGNLVRFGKRLPGHYAF